MTSFSSDEECLHEELGVELSVAIEQAARDKNDDNVQVVRFNSVQIKSEAKTMQVMTAIAERSRTTLRRVDLSRCELSPGMILSFLVEILPSLDRFTRKPTDVDSGAALDLSSQRLTSADVNRLCSSLTRTFKGVTKLHLSRTDVDDACLPSVASRFPNLRCLHLDGTRVKMRCCNLAKRLPGLELLDLDRTECDGASADQILNLMKTRLLSDSAAPLHVWARQCTEITTSWSNLIAFCCSSKNSKSFHLEHDLLDRRARGEGRRRIVMHDVVEVHVFSPHAKPIVVKMRHVAGTSSIETLASRTISQLNRTILDFDAGCETSCLQVVGRKREFLEAFESSKSLSAMSRKQFKLGVIQLVEINRHTKEKQTHSSKMDTRLLGKPLSHVDIVIQIEAERA